MKVDLHTHTTASDGQYSPTELLRIAENKGVEVIAITDHDTVDGIKIAMESIRDFNIKLITGIEFGTRDDRHMHILGYNFDIENPRLNKACEVLKNARHDRKHRLIKFLNDKGLKISLEEVEKAAGSDLIARPHFAAVMIEKGYVKDIDEAFKKYLDTDEFQAIERFKYTARECIEIIQVAGGKAVLAHPVQLNLSYEELETALIKLKKWGLDGLECYYTTHSQEQTEKYLKLAKKLNLIVTAGSDFHGEKVKSYAHIFTKELDISPLL